MNGTSKLLLGAGAAAAAAVLYATVLEPRWLQRTHTRLHFRRLPPVLEGLRVALLTDLHANGMTPRSQVRRAVQAAQEARPHLVAITGDIAESPVRLERALDELARLRAPLGVYIVPGNHDHRDVGIERWREAVARHPALEDLTNAACVLRVERSGAPAARLCLAGVDDLAEGEPSLEALPPVAERDFTILLAHQPDQAEHARRSMDSVDLVLSGHTHGGQVRLPGVGAVVNSAERPDLYEAGVRRRPWTQVYTSRGVGMVHAPVRLLTRPEVAILELTSEPRPPGRRGRGERPGGVPAADQRPVS